MAGVPVTDQSRRDRTVLFYLAARDRRARSVGAGRGRGIVRQGRCRFPPGPVPRYQEKAARVAAKAVPRRASASRCPDSSLPCRAVVQGRRASYQGLRGVVPGLRGGSREWTGACLRECRGVVAREVPVHEAVRLVSGAGPEAAHVRPASRCRSGTLSSSILDGSGENQVIPACGGVERGASWKGRAVFLELARLFERPATPGPGAVGRKRWPALSRGACFSDPRAACWGGFAKRGRGVKPRAEGCREGKGHDKVETACGSSISLTLGPGVLERQQDGSQATSSPNGVSESAFRGPRLNVFAPIRRTPVRTQKKNRTGREGSEWKRKARHHSGLRGAPRAGKTIRNRKARRTG